MSRSRNNSDSAEPGKGFWQSVAETIESLVRLKLGKVVELLQKQPRRALIGAAVLFVGFCAYAAASCFKPRFESWTRVITGISPYEDFDTITFDCERRSVARGCHHLRGETRVSDQIQVSRFTVPWQGPRKLRVIILRAISYTAFTVGAFNVQGWDHESAETRFSPTVVATRDPHDVHFGFNSSTASEEERQNLEAVVDTLRAHPDWAVLVVGHTDRVDTDDYNYELAAKRAEGIARELVSRNIPRSHVYPVTFGKTKLINMGDTEQDQAANRRVEFLYVQRALLP
jgi:peptidoglycan-associated lipoprotein